MYKKTSRVGDKRFTRTEEAAGVRSSVHGGGALIKILKSLLQDMCEDIYRPIHKCWNYFTPYYCSWH